MADEAKNAPTGEPKPTEAAAAAAVDTKPDGKAAGANPDAKPAGQQQAQPDTTTVAQALGSTTDTNSDDGKTDTGKQKESPRMVPEAVVIELKKDLKALKQQMAEGATREEVDESLKAIGEEYNVDPNFLQKLTGAIRSKTESEFQEKLDKALEPYKSQSSADKEAKFETVFTEHFNRTLEAMPEFDGVANKEVIKALVRDPKNANKTFAQIIEGAYGHLVQGKRTIDGGRPGSGKDITEIDFERAQKDSSYYAQIMASPSLKAKYNEELPKRLKL